MSLINKVLPISINRDAIPESLVESVLPKFLTGIGIPFQTLGRERLAREIEDADLLMWEGRDMHFTRMGRENTIVGYHLRDDAESPFIVTYE